VSVTLKTGTGLISFKVTNCDLEDLPGVKGTLDAQDLRILVKVHDTEYTATVPHQMKRAGDKKTTGKWTRP